MPSNPIDSDGAFHAEPSVLLLGSDARTNEIKLALQQAGVRTVSAVGEDPRPPDIAIVAAGADERQNITRRVLEGGSSAYLTWPPCASPEEGEELLALADESGVVVGVEPPLPIGPWMDARPDGWSARIVSFASVASISNRGPESTWSRRLAGALDLSIRLVGGPDVTRIEAQADPSSGPLDERALALSLRFRNGAYAQVLLRATSSSLADGPSLFASGAGFAMEASSFDAAPVFIPDVDGSALGERSSLDSDVVQFVTAIRSGIQVVFTLQDAIDTMRLVEAVQERMR